MLASDKELFTPRRKWNQYRKGWSGLEQRKRLLHSYKKRSSVMSLNANMRKSVRRSSAQNVTDGD